MEIWQCHYCRSSLPLDIQMKNRLCPSCGSDLHCCKNCLFYDEELTSKCRETNSPWVGDRTTQNACEFFEMRPTSYNPRAAENAEALSEAERAKDAFRALFRNS